MKKLSLFVFTLFICISVKSQDGIESILLSGTEDANKLTKAYITPAMKGLIYGMNSGWYHTAKVHKKLGFDISIGLNASIVPSSDELFKFADLGLSSSTTSNSLTAPTVAGSNIETTINYSGTIEGQQVTASFNMPGGIKDDLPISAMPTPSIQLAVGLPYKMDVMVRLVPKIGSDDVKGQLLGLGLKKDITSIFGSLNKLPLHISLVGAFTTMNVDYDIQNESSISGSNQLAEFKLNSFTIQAIASLNFPVINLYGGIGYGGGTSDLKMKGTYELEYSTGLPAPNNIITSILTDPLNLAFKAGGIQTTLGARLSLGFFKIYGDYTIKEYSTISTGIAFSFR